MPWAPKQKCATPRCRNLVDSGWCDECQRAALSDVNMTVVAGAPGSGKTTYVREHKQPGDLVIDMDAIAVALGSDVDHDHDGRLLPFAFAARDAVIDRLGRPNDLRAVWIIRGAPTFAERHQWWQAKVVVIAPPIDEAKRRAREAGRPASWDRLIDEWWAQYEPRSGDLVIEN